MSAAQSEPHCIVHSGALLVHIAQLRSCKSAEVVERLRNEAGRGHLVTLQAGIHKQAVLLSDFVLASDRDLQILSQDGVIDVSGALVGDDSEAALAVVADYISLRACSLTVSTFGPVIRLLNYLLAEGTLSGIYAHLDTSHIDHADAMVMLVQLGGYRLSTAGMASAKLLASLHDSKAFQARLRETGWDDLLGLAERLVPHLDAEQLSGMSHRQGPLALLLPCAALLSLSKHYVAECDMPRAGTAPAAKRARTRKSAAARAAAAVKLVTGLLTMVMCGLRASLSSVSHGTLAAMHATALDRFAQEAVLAGKLTSSLAALAPARSVLSVLSAALIADRGALALLAPTRSVQPTWDGCALATGAAVGVALEDRLRMVCRAGPPVVASASCTLQLVHYQVDDMRVSMGAGLVLKAVPGASHQVKIRLRMEFCDARLEGYLREDMYCICLPAFFSSVSNLRGACSGALRRSDSQATFSSALGVEAKQLQTGEVCHYEVDADQAAYELAFPGDVLLCIDVPLIKRTVTPNDS